MVGDLVAERYELEELVGSGGMSRVFRARDRLLDRQVALKILHDQYLEDEDYVERFRREARAAAQLGHPNIVTVIDRGRANGCEYIVFEYVEGENLKQLVSRKGPLPVERALELAIEVGRALEYAHANGLVHRDVKPQNVLLGNGRARVTDFGIARALDVRGLTQTGTVLGTSDYIAPEQAQGLGASEQSDVYSLGVVLYELLAGAPPFSGEGFLQVALRHVHDDVPSLLERRPDVPLRVVAAVETALEKDPADRFPTMAAFVAELRACAGELRSDGAAPTAVIRTRERERRQAVPPPARGAAKRFPRAALLLLLAGLAAVAAAVGIYLASRGGSPAPTVGGGTVTVKTADVKLTAAAAFDPQGTAGEHDDMARLATDGDLATYWETEHYASQDFGGLKSGVGLVVDASRAVRLERLTVATDTPGFTAVVRAGASASGPFSDVSPSQTVGRTAAFSLHVPSPRRYYLLWITRLTPDGVRFQTHVNEVSTKALQAPPQAPPPPPPPPPPAATATQANVANAPAAEPRGKGRGHGRGHGKKG